MNLFDILHRNAAEHPDRVICEDEEHSYTFSEMETVSGKIYRYLRDRQIGREDIVAIRLPRSGMIPLVMLGVWKAGAAFVVIGEHTPPELAEYQLNETKPKLIFSTVQLAEALRCDFTAGYESRDAHDLCCVVYSTGSTGVFKGSMHEYGAIQKGVDRTQGFCKYYGFSAIGQSDYRLIFSSGFYAINAVFSLLDSLVLGYYQYVLPYRHIEDICEIGKVLTEKRINCYSATTRDYPAIKALNSPYLKELSVSLDMISCSFTPEQPLYNYYGMSESICLLSCFPVDRSYDITPIGKPYRDIPMIIADRNGNPLPDGEIGEICFVPEYWRGYIAQPEKTRSAFWGGWFHTGDMGYVNGDGNFVIVGRKIDIAETENGYIVPVFIETAFRKAFPEAEGCHVQLFRQASPPIIALYYRGKGEYSARQVRAVLRETLPEYALPDFCRRMDDFPYYPSGKLNRNAFPKPDQL